MKLVLVDWIDAAGGADGWVDKDTFEKPDMRCQTVGWLAHEDNESITIASTTGKTDHSEWTGTMTIPRGWLQKFTILKPEEDASQPAEHRTESSPRDKAGKESDLTDQQRHSIVAAQRAGGDNGHLTEQLGSGPEKPYTEIGPLEIYSRARIGAPKPPPPE